MLKSQLGPIHASTVMTKFHFQTLKLIFDAYHVDFKVYQFVIFINFQLHLKERLSNFPIFLVSRQNQILETTKLYLRSEHPQSTLDSTKTIPACF